MILLGQVREDDLAERRGLIDCALNRLSGPSALREEELPRSEEELEALCDMRSDKADALKEEPNPIPEPPYLRRARAPGADRPEEVFSETHIRELEHTREAALTASESVEG